jgi:hypothetical protein
MLLVLAADLRYAAARSETFGLAGILWIAGIALLLCSAFFGSHSLWGVSSAPRLPRWPTWEIALMAVLFVLTLHSRVWNLTNFSDDIYPDEIMTGTVATQSYLSPTTPPPSVFSTLWSGIDLPVLWFWFVAVFLKLGGTSLAILRLPPALCGAATVISLFALLRGTSGRYARRSLEARSWLSAFQMFITAAWRLTTSLHSSSGPLVCFSCCAHCGRAAHVIGLWQVCRLDYSLVLHIRAHAT